MSSRDRGRHFNVEAERATRSMSSPLVGPVSLNTQSNTHTMAQTKEITWAVSADLAAGRASGHADQEGLSSHVAGGLGPVP